MVKALLKAEPAAAAIANAEGYSVMHLTLTLALALTLAPHNPNQVMHVAADLGRDRVLQILITHGSA